MAESTLQRGGRGAPSTIRGGTGAPPRYGYREVRRPTRRALATPLSDDFSMAELRAAANRLSTRAARRKLKVLERPLVVLRGDPTKVPTTAWRWSVALPVSGRATADAEAGITLERVHGGVFVETTTAEGFGSLRGLYRYFLNELLPAHKQQLTRPEIYHRVIDGLENDDPNRCSLAVYLPFYLTLKRPLG